MGLIDANIELPKYDHQCFICLTIGGETWLKRLDFGAKHLTICPNCFKELKDNLGYFEKQVKNMR